MRNRCAVVIVYQGREITPEEHRKIAEAFMQCTDCVTNAENLEVYGLNGKEVAIGVTIKAIENATTRLSQIDEAAMFIGETFASSISAGIPTFAANITTTYVNVKMRGYSMLSEKEQQLVSSIELLAQKDAFACISNSIKKKYRITLAIVNAIAQIYDGICQEHIVI